MPAKLFRIILQVADLEKATGFYSNLLEAEGRAVGGGRVYFDCGPMILALLVPEKKPVPIAEYVYFSVDKVEDFHARAKKLSALSSEKVHGESAGEIIARPWGERSFYAFDPSGNGLCFVDETTLFTGARR